MKFFVFWIAHTCLWLCLHYLWFLAMVWRKQGNKATFDYIKFAGGSALIGFFSSLGTYLLWGQ